MLLHVQVIKKKRKKKEGSNYKCNIGDNCVVIKDNNDDINYKV